MEICIRVANSGLGRLIPVRLGQALSLFNEGRFFDAHEALEDLWRDAPKNTPARRHLQGLVQLAVAFHHHSTGNCVGALSVLKRGLRNLDGANKSLPALNMSRLEIQLERWLEFLEYQVMSRGDQTAQDDSEHLVDAPAPPQISLRE